MSPAERVAEIQRLLRARDTLARALVKAFTLQELADIYEGLPLAHEAEPPMETLVDSVGYAWAEASKRAQT